MPTYNSTNARKEFFPLLERVTKEHEILTITGKHGNAVMISEEDWENISETLHLNNIPKMAKSIQSGLNEPLDKCSTKPGW